MSKQFAITAKKTRKPISDKHYLDFLDRTKDLGEIGNVNLETTKGLHVHFVLKCNSLRYRDVYPSKVGWSIKIVPIFNKDGWVKYVRKDHLINKDLNKCVQKYNESDSPIDMEYCEPVPPKKSLFKRIKHDDVSNK